ncbi:cyclase family protein [Halobacteriales archaeon Cl-PHB]
MKTVDCSQPVESGMPVYPGDDPVSVEVSATVPEDGSCMRKLSVSSHVGTHVDAPSHKVADGPTLSDFDVTDFRFNARLVDCTACNPRQRLTVDDLPAAVREHPDEAADNPMLVFRTGWSGHWGSERYRDSPFLEPDLAAWCAERGFHVGIDAFSPDPVASADPDREGAEEPTDTPAHAALCGAERLIVENLRGLDRLPNQFQLVAYPLAIREGDGSPVRAVAHVEA